MNISFQCPANTAFAIKYERQQSKKQQLDKTLLSTKRQAPALKKQNLTQPFTKKIQGENRASYKSNFAPRLQVTPHHRFHKHSKTKTKALTVHNVISLRPTIFCS